MTEHAVGQLFIVAAPSGGGKTSLVTGLVKALPKLEISISHTTRDQRPGEKESEHYFFVSESQFMKMVEAGEFIEHAEVYGHRYGTAWTQIDQRLKAGIDVILDIDWQGAQQLRRRFEHAVSIFILPPSLDTLRQRLTERARDQGEVIRQRMEKAQAEIQHFSEFDYLIVNEVFETALNQLKAVVEAARLKTPIQTQRHQQLLSLLVG